MITPSWYPDRKQLRQFAVVALPGFALIGRLVYSITASTQVGWTLAALGPVVMVAGLIKPESVRWLYLLLCGLAFPIGWAVSAVLLRVIFYLILTPVGLFFRLIGRDPLRLRRPVGDTYWIDHRDRAGVAAYFRQA